MSFPTSAQTASVPDTEATPLDQIEQAIRANTFLKLSILDIMIEGKTLVAAVDDSVPTRFVARILRGHWAGPVEVYCPNDIMTGMSA